MNWIQQNKNNLTIFALAILMALTRSDHFGSALTLPDASLAVFYLAGIFTGGLASFAVLLAEAALLDYVSISQFQVSNYCISPAYVFLIPTYAVMFFAGRWSTKYVELNASDLSRQFAYLFAAGSIAFLISNSSFYLLSGKFPEMSLIEYTGRVAKYYPDYMSSTLIYSFAILLFTKLVRTVYLEKYKLA